jgi:acyl transferase domain-containing protein/NAD(P)H-dependent flavin oxidoreductase YrpB (nitropropane dioxygenase family)/NAD(P)-dependent dehydrogenase (short-subunit alcohol dehydrogenase family)/acyl carrier protein
MELSDLIVLTPAGHLDPSLAIAACRASARGTLDLECATDRSAAVAAIRRLAQFVPGPYGVRVGPTNAAALRDLLGIDIVRPAWVILSCGNHADLGRWVSKFRRHGVEVLVEAVTLAEAVRGAELGADGVILKGHEAGGRVGPDTALVLIQKWRQWADTQTSAPPFWVRGGVGPNTAAACLVAGARGVVLDAQVLLARESPASDELRQRLTGCDGGETTVLGERLGEAFRLYSRADSPAARELAAEEERLLAADLVADDRLAAWREAVRSRITDDPTTGIWLVGQDIAVAAGLAAKYVTVAGIAQAIVAQAVRQAETAHRLRPLAEGSPLAQSHGTRYPILQGPMTRVSDTAAFAEAVAAGGGLPFLALALSRKPEVEKLLAETQARLGDRPWGVGILGFVPPELREEQLDAVRAVKPPFAIIAGGRPDQAKELEQHGTATYLHVPSPGLLRMFLKDGARRFIFEGRECGGHVGPRTSFALWETMVGVLSEYVATAPGDDLHVVFAGGVHDGLSAAMVAALSAGLAERGVKVGVLLGTAYLFTKEAVAAGAITERFQKEALACGETVLLETGPGHAIRCIPTPYAEAFEAEKRRLKAEGKSPLEVGLALERMNLGRLRVASKGVDRTASGTGSGLAAVPDDEQHRRGMYMIGQVAALRSDVTTITELHADISTGADQRLQRVESPILLPPEPDAPPPCDVAIIGLSCFYPQAGGLWPYWENILAKVNAVIEIPPTHWDWRLYYDPDPRAKDKIISKWGGFIGDVPFNPLKYGITPKSIPNIEPLQLLLLEAVNQALGDAGYLDRPYNRERTCAILGVGGGGMPLSVAYGFRACMPLMDTIPGVPIKSSQVVELGEGILPEWTEDSFPGILLNVAAGRVSNRFNLGGPNMAIDAACGSSLAALYAGVRELCDGTSDVAVVMGADAVQTPYAYVAFSKTHALSPRGRCRPFDASADGIALAEGIGVAVLKRLKDAERDGDRIYAVIKGVGASSDGRDKGLTAPRAEGQLRALHRAYAQARISPARVGLVEAHGTGTVVGDRTEAMALGKVFRDAGGAPRSAALGSVKSMIGHSKCAAGLAGLIKAAFALHHKVLPPTLVETPNPKANLDDGPLYLNTEARPWVHGAAHPRTAGVSAFGFGGTNFHAVLEEYTGDFLNRPSCGLRHWPAELFVWRRPDTAALLAAVKHCRDALAAGATPEPADLAASLWQSSRGGAGQPTLAVVAGSLNELREKLDAALAALPKANGAHTDPRGIYFAASPGHAAGTVAFLFPGQGSQYPDMLAQTAIAFPEVREVLDTAERVLLDKLERPLGKFIYPPSPFTPEQEQANRKELQRTEIAQPAVGAASLGMARLLATLGIEPDFLAGHSYGEYVALAAAGAMSDEELILLSHRRGEVIKDAAAAAPGGMIAAEGTPEVIEPLLKGVAEAWIANHNAPTQTVIAGTEAGLKAAAAALQAAGIRSQRIPVACGFHSPLVAAAKGPLAEALAAVRFNAPRKPVFSNTTTAPHGEPKRIAQQLAEHLVSPVRFAAEIEAMYQAGARIFVEVGPQAVLTGLAAQTLAGKPHLAIASDQKSRPGLVQLAHLLGQLLAHGVSARLDRLYQGRGVVPFDLAKLGPDTGKPKLPPTTWLVNGVRSRPLNGPEPRLLGQPLPSSAVRKEGPEVNGSGAAQSKPPQPHTPPSSLPRGEGHPTPAATPPVSSPVAPVTPRATMHHDPTPTVIPSANGSASAPPPDAAAQVMLRFQDVMARFLDTQRSVMLSYLGTPGGGTLPPLNGHTASVNGPAGSAVPPAVANRLTSVESPRPAPAPPQHEANGHAVAATTTEANGKHSATEPPTAAPAAVAPPAKLDRESLLETLLDLVSERTGYPKESLSIDLDLEADLGIDSIKRVEILGTLAESLGTAADGQQPNLEMEKLSVIKTLRGIADYVLEALAGSASATPAPSTNGPPKPAPHPGARQGDVQRLVVRLIDAPLSARPRFAPPTGTILITDDRRGTARELADRLAELDVKTVLIRHADSEPASDGTFAADLTDPAAVADLASRLRDTCGPIAGLIHLLPLAEPSANDTPEQRMQRDVKGLYLLARALENDIRVAGQAGGAVLLAVTAMGGQMGFGGDLPDDFFPGHGGVAGFVKCLGYEWPEATVRVVDVDGETPAPQLAEMLLAELGDPDGPFEVGRAGGRRVTWEIEPGPLDKSEAAVELGPDSTVLITGGARGITAKIALELARRYQPRLVLVGSSPEPTDEPAATAGLTAPAEIKAALMKQQPDAKPAAIEAAYRRLMKDREIRDNLAAIRAAGGTVEYRAVDVRNAAAFGALIEELNGAGGITGVIHGAGVIDDKLLRDKTPESFDRVFGTKVSSALTLARTLDPQRLKFLALFASITSRYGNRGQSDYAAANEVLSKLACDLDRRWPGRVVSVAWGPWAEVGMVADLEKHLVARGLKLIEPAVGAGFAVDEVIYGTKGEPEVVVAGGTEQAARPQRTAAPAEAVAVAAE